MPIRCEDTRQAERVAYCLVQFSGSTIILSQQVGVYDLTKRQAGTVIDVLSQNNGAVANGRGRHSR